MYRPSPYPENYSTRDVFKGVNIYTNTPNRYPYMWDRQPFPSLYYNSPNQKITPKVFPYTNRPWDDYTIYSKPEYYEGLLQDRDLIPAYTFYKMN